MVERPAPLSIPVSVGVIGTLISLYKCFTHNRKLKKISCELIKLKYSIFIKDGGAFGWSREV